MLQFYTAGVSERQMQEKSTMEMKYLVGVLIRQPLDSIRSFEMDADKWGEQRSNSIYDSVREFNRYFFVLSRQLFVSPPVPSSAVPAAYATYISLVFLPRTESNNFWDNYIKYLQLVYSIRFGPRVY
jgi:hypothetical protein